MPRGFAQGPKDPFQDLAPEFKDAIASSDRDQIKARLTQVYRDESENQRLMREDLHLQETKVKVDKLAAPYKQRKSEAKLAAQVAVKQDDHSAATDAAIALVDAEADEEKDNDLSSTKEELKDAKAQYVEGTKMNKLKIAYCLKVLKDKGGASTKPTSLAEAVEGLKNAVPGATMTIIGPDGREHTLK